MNKDQRHPHITSMLITKGKPVSEQIPKSLFMWEDGYLIQLTTCLHVFAKFEVVVLENGKYWQILKCTD